MAPDSFTYLIRRMSEQEFKIWYRNSWHELNEQQYDWVVFMIEAAATGTSILITPRRRKGMGYAYKVFSEYKKYSESKP